MVLLYFKWHESCTRHCYLAVWLPLILSNWIGAKLNVVTFSRSPKPSCKLGVYTWLFRSLQFCNAKFHFFNPGDISVWGVIRTFDRMSFYVYLNIVVVVVVVVNIIIIINTVTVLEFVAHHYNDSRIAQAVQFHRQMFPHQSLTDLCLHSVGRSDKSIICDLSQVHAFCETAKGQ